MTVYSGALTASALGAALLGVYVWRQRPERTCTPLSALAAAVAVWTTCASLEAMVPTLESKRMWAALAYVGGASTAPLCFLFAGAYVERFRLRSRLAAALFVVPALTCIIAITNGRHGLQWSSVVMVDTWAGPQGKFEHGPWYWVHTGYSYALISASIVLLLQASRDEDRVRANQARWLVAAFLAPFLGNALYVAFPEWVSGIDLAPIGFTLSLGALAWAIQRHRLLRLHPLARAVLFEGLEDGVLFLDSRRRIVDVNAAARRFAGLGADARGGPLTAATPVCRAVAELTHAAQDGETEVTSAPGQWLRIRSLRLGDRAARTFGWLVVLQDVTRDREGAEALRKSEERLRIAAHTTSQIVWDRDLESGRIEWTGPLEEITGLDAADVARLDASAWMARVYPDDRAEAAAALERTLRDGAEYRVDYRFERKDGSYVQVEDVGRLLPVGEGASRRMVGTMRDITERARAEEHRLTLERQWQHTQKLESLGVLAGGIAHDFNNLLTVILGRADLALADSPRGSSTHRAILEIVKASRRAADLCRQMLAYSGRGHFVVGDLDVNEIVREMAGLIRTSISKKATLTLDLGADLPPIRGDATQLRQVVLNLITNASEALAGRPGSILVRTRAGFIARDELDGFTFGGHLPPGGYLSLEVRDNGSGMSPDTLQRIFEPFFTTKFTGRGLGLSAVLGIVRGHRGALRVTSAPGLGTSFVVLVPALAATAEREPRPLATAAAANDATRRTVLLVDDEEMVRSLGAAMLQQLGHRVLTAVDGDEALRLFRERASEIDAVVLDLTMPGPDSDEVVRELRKTSPSVRVILTSGFSEQEALPRVHTARAFLQKPYELADLERVLAHVFGRAATPQDVDTG